METRTYTKKYFGLEEGSLEEGRDKSLLFGGAGCNRIFASIIPSNHRKEE